MGTDRAAAETGLSMAQIESAREKLITSGKRRTNGLEELGKPALREKSHALRDWRKHGTNLIQTMSPTQQEFRRAMGCFATGVTVITVDNQGKVEGMTANAFTSVSLDPILVLVCVDHKARTHAHLHARKRFGINVLSQQQQKISEYYAQVDRDPAWADSEAGARFERTRHGTPVLEGALAYLECGLQTTQEAGDHTIFIAEVEDVVVREGRPLVYFQSAYHEIGGRRK
jgi:flavin reductase (DIM6/NTAB) family NADH-FMN oxidoreductase RutF